MSDEMFTHPIKSLWQDMPGGGDAFRLGKGRRADEKSERGRYYQFYDHSGGVRNVTRQSLLIQPSGQIMLDIQHFTSDY